jgi:carboxylate-amine ligase
MEIAFNSSPEPTLGIEVELQVVDLETMDHLPAAEHIIAKLGEPPNVKHELFASTVEILTGVCTTVAEARTDLQGILDELHALGDEEGWALISSGTHPFADWREEEISPDPRYRALIDRIQWPARRLSIYGIHYHVGIDSKEKAIAVMNSLGTYIPHVLALSSSSPFWLGNDTGLASTRAQLFQVMPTAGLPYQLANWGQFLRYMEALRSSRAIESIREVWTDIRPHPGFGTIEMRVSDATPTLTEVMASAALIQSLVVMLSRRYDRGTRLPLVSPWVVKENKWRATRFGLNADLITDDDGNLKPITSSIRDLLDQLFPVARELGCDKELADLETIMQRGPSSDRQRQVFEQTGSLVEVARSLVTELRTDSLTPF